jgi:hypothetical protein
MQSRQQQGRSERNLSRLLETTAQVVDVYQTRWLRDRELRAGTTYFKRYCPERDILTALDDDMDRTGLQDDIVTDTYIEGDNEFDALVLSLDSLSFMGEPFIRAGHQRMFHNKMIKAVMPLIYRKSWDRAYERILRKRGFGDQATVKQEVIISCPRQYGKSLSVASFMAALLYTQSGMRIIVVSRTQRQAQELTERIWAFFCTLPGGTAMKIKKNSEQLIVSKTGDKHDPLQNRLTCIPGNAEGTRGITADVIVLEEAAFIEGDLFFDTVLPLMGVNKTAIIGISTPPKSHMNYFLQMFELKDKAGEPLFEIVKLRLLCDDCIAKNKDDCPHIREEAPPWKSKRREERTRVVYQADMERFNREVRGVETTSDVYVFPKDKIDLIETRPPVRFSIPPRFIYFAIDPSGGGTGSDTAWVVMSFDEQGMGVVCFFLLLSSFGWLLYTGCCCCRCFGLLRSLLLLLLLLLYGGGKYTMRIPV